MKNGLFSQVENIKEEKRGILLIHSYQSKIGFLRATIAFLGLRLKNLDFNGFDGEINPSYPFQGVDHSDHSMIFNVVVIL